MDGGSGILRAAIGVSWLSYAAALVLQIALAAGWIRPRSVPTVARLWWGLWIVAWAGLLVHTWAAFQFVHHWSHAHAWSETARQTGEMLGWQFGAGIYFSYLLLVLWTVELMWSGRQPLLDRPQPTGLRGAVHGYIFFIILNGVVTFQTGWYRWTGALLLVLAIWGVCTWRLRRRWAPA